MELVNREAPSSEAEDTRRGIQRSKAKSLAPG